MSMSEDKTRKMVLPRVRITSQTFDHSSFGNVSQRTVSSSSIVSTPSNNIRRVQNTRPKRPEELRVGGVQSTARTSKKLLNLLKLKKTHALPKPFVLRRPVSMSKYDYSVFVGSTGEPMPPVKESQIQAWESAEKISASIIFDHDVRSSDAFSIFDDASRDETFDDDSVCAEAESSINRGAQRTLGRSGQLILSIPGYTRGELKIVMDNFAQFQSAGGANFAQFAETEEKALWLHRQQQSAAQEKAFMAYRTLSGKRKVQIHHKKEFLHKLFGYSNNLNQEHITNNTLYSAVDNVANAQKAFHEDKDEIFQLLEADKDFKDAMAEARAAYDNSSVNAGYDAEYDPAQLSNITQAWLTREYNQDGGSSLAHAGDDPEVLALTLAHLKQCVRDGN